MLPLVCAMVYTLPDGKTKSTVEEPPVVVRARETTTGVPQTNAGEVVIWKGVALVTTAPDPMAGYVDAGWLIVTPGVLVLSVALVAVTVPWPIFWTSRVNRLQSLGLINP